jgi:signal transduction histidine kinase
MNAAVQTRVLIVDDTREIHADFEKILLRNSPSTVLDALEREAFGGSQDRAAVDWSISYALDSAYQGSEALERVNEAARNDARYALAFIDMRMPPGWDGLQTIEQLWNVDPQLQVVICSAYSDYDWLELLGRLKQPDNLLVIKKPFEAVEVLQCANALAKKWHAECALREHLSSLEQVIQARTKSLEEANVSLREQMRLREVAEMELRLAQKLEAVGRLAAGIAHEINTPIQYISDSIYFLGTAFDEMLAFTKPSMAAEADPQSIADFKFLTEEIPRAISRTTEGAERVATIVRAMKEFAHPDGGEKTGADLNRALETTLLISRNEYKYVASAELIAGDIPEVVCNVGELGQVFLNLVVNSAHAIADAGHTPDTGRITLRTSREGDFVAIEFEDNGCGIPPDIVDKIYDPFFTTKEVGRGTGQGLAIARSIVVDKHEGQISVVSTPGQGARFTIRLPVGPVPEAVA